MARNKKRLEIHLAYIKIPFFFNLANSNMSVSWDDNYPEEKSITNSTNRPNGHEFFNKIIRDHSAYPYYS